MMKTKSFTILETVIIVICVSALTALITLAVTNIKEATDEKKVDLDKYQQVTKLGTITDTLLSNYETYSYMNGTYLKGNVQNNYIWYNGFIWRIMGKNEDGSIRLITEENIASLIYGREEVTSFKDSYVNNWLNDYFLPQLKEQNKIVESHFCIDESIIRDKNSNRTNCSNVTSVKVGLLSLDEYNLSGGMNGYLHNGLSFATLTPGYANTNWNIIDTALPNAESVTHMIGYRAIISLSPELIITSGNGTLTANQDTEYIAQKESNLTDKLIKNVVTVGEYLKFDGKLYRVLEVNGNQVQLILDDFTDMKMTYGKDFTTMDEFLKSDSFLFWLVPTRGKELLDTTWYRGESFAYGEDCNKNLSSKTNEYQGKVGISRIGELFTSQSLSILTQNYTTKIDGRNAKQFWTSTPNTESISWFVNGLGNIGSVDLPLSIRPIIVLSSNVKIVSGTGLLSSPYEI